MNQKKIGKFIAELRKEKDLTQEELASKVGITKNAVSKWERGLSMMDVSLMQPVCDILGISIVELLNGEKINQEDIKSKSESTLKDTIAYSKKKIKKSKIKSIIFTTLVIALLLVVGFFGYKFVLLNVYTLKRPDSVEEVVKGLKNSSELKLYKKTIPEDEYLVVENFKIRNDFKDYKLTLTSGNDDGGKTYTYRSDKYGMNIGFVNEALLLNNAFAAPSAEFYGENNLNFDPNAFNYADRKFFLLKNDINNEVDFLKYVADHYYIENNIFMDRRTMMENYAFNLFVETAVPSVKSITYLKGDYEGYICKIGEGPYVYQVTIIRDNKGYYFMTNDERLEDENYMIDLLSTIEIR